VRVNDRVGGGNHILPAGNQPALKTLGLVCALAPERFPKIHSANALHVVVHNRLRLPIGPASFKVRPTFSILEGVCVWRLH
jgi:hypothetical protein